MHSLTPRFLQRLTFTAEDASTLQRLGEAKGRQDLFTRQTPEILESLHQVAIVESAESERSHRSAIVMRCRQRRNGVTGTILP